MKNLDIDAVTDAMARGDVTALRQALRADLMQHHHQIPDALKSLSAWVCWNCTEIKNGKFNKIPYYPNGTRRHGEQDSAQDRAQLGAFEQAFAAFQNCPGEYAGVGLAMLPDLGIVAFDADRCVTNGDIRDDVAKLTDETYAEISPSGTGIRAFWYGTATNGRNNERGFELYAARQFVTVTGYVIDNLNSILSGEIAQLSDELRSELEAVCRSEGKATTKPTKTQKLTNAVVNDPVYTHLAEQGMIERDMGGGKFSILCPFEEGHSDYGRSGGDGDTAYFIAHTNGYAQGHFQCLHASCADKRDGDFLEAVGFLSAGFDDLTISPDEPVLDALLHHPTQDNVALIFRQQLNGRLLYAHKFAAWFEWDGTRWRCESTERAFDFARALARKVNRNGKGSISSAAFCNGVEAFARADRAFAITGDEFDIDNYQLNTPIGTFDLRENVLRQHSPDDRITKITNASPTPEGGERFRQFLSEITGGDESLIRFLKMSLGACLSGAVEGHWMMFWTGGGRNGKNTLGDLVMHVMGEYGRKIPASTLMAKTHEAHPTELASLKGVRLATSSEVSEGAHWNEARINELTGDALIAARVMRGDFFEFKRTHKHLIYGNHRPQLRSITPALKSRLKIVPFRQSFVGREDPMLPEKLHAEAGYVLHWLLGGHAEWLAAGRKLPHCEAVERESGDYFEAQSTVDAWIAERLEIVKNDGRKTEEFPKSSDLYDDYARWKKFRGEFPVSLTRWAESMRGFEKVKSNGFRYKGIKLPSDESALCA